jgi:hypothetical protein
MLMLTVDIATMLIGEEGARLLREKRVKGDPAGAERRGGSPDRPRKASAWSGNQQASLTDLLFKKILQREGWRQHRQVVHRKKRPSVARSKS